MKKVFKKIINSIKNFFNRMADQEAERIIDYYSQIFETKSDEGGVNERIKTNACRISKFYSIPLEKEERKMKKLVLAILLVGFISFSFATGPRLSCAGEVDILLQKLVEKGILTPGEAQQIGTETKEQVKKEIAKGTYSSLPSWVQNTKLKGDFRLRYQLDHAKTLASGSGTTTTNNRNQARIRLRLGLESKVNDKILVGVGLATGKDDASTIDKDQARSTNQSLGNGFSKHPVTLDYAFVQYSPVSWATIIGGKFKNPLWEPGDLIWDTDINPEGAAVKLTKKLNSKIDLFLTPGIFIIDEYSDEGEDPIMGIMQAGITSQFTDTVSLKTAVSYYDAANVKDLTLDGTTGTNSNTTSSTSGKLLYGYQNIIPAVELTIKEPFKKLGLSLPYLALFGEFVDNVSSSVKQDNTGYMVGLKFGAEKIEKWADWQVRYNYAMLGRDAILDILPDSDRYGGKTGMRSHELMFDWGLGKNTWLGLDYYYGWQLKGNFGSQQSKPASVIQVDWNVKF
ncbi:MAG: putative porin [Candidatus Omnitrophica bacterium]|nr:putative porin [Candidatus Omnitrophota bacterium]MDD5351565.1 putative porin [Candidatus Omnitrophota bacterium]MDD5551000.1 putative porin [Candidatus Omnitrophota bacterium]